MSAVELLAVGSKADAGTGAAVDVSAAKMLRQTITVAAATDLGVVTQLRLMIDTGPSSSGPWSEIRTITMRPGSPSYDATAWSNAKRFVIGEFDSFARVRWETEKRNNGSTGLSFGVAGTD